MAAEDIINSNSIAEDDGMTLRRQNMDTKGGDIVNRENDLTEIEGGTADNSSDMELSLETDEVISLGDKFNPQVHARTITVNVEGEPDTFSSRVHADNGCHEAQTESPLHHPVTSGTAKSGVKRARMTYDDQQPSVHVVYNSITRASKKRLQELLHQWSEWQAEDCSSNKDPNEVVESGEETYFPALHVGREKSSAVSFWIDSQVRGEHHNGFVPPDVNSVPFYDRGCALGLTSEDVSKNLSGSLGMIDNATRCFNCGSYSHSLKECPKPRDGDAVDKARKQYMAKKKKQHGGSRNPIRYYQNSPGGKYDDLKPGTLSAETRQLFGLAEFDPPPWLNKMRELGYPPGYLAPEDEDEPSGITIFADEETKEDKDAEVIQMRHSLCKLKEIVEFPGINAPIPADADAMRWASVSSSSGDLPGSGAHQQYAYSPKPDGKVHHGQGLFTDYSDEGPPRIKQFSPVMSYTPRNRIHNTSFCFPSPRDHVQNSTSPISGRPFRGYGEDGPPGISQGFSPLMSYPPRYGSRGSIFSYQSPSYYVPRPRSPVLGRVAIGQKLGEPFRLWCSKR